MLSFTLTLFLALLYIVNDSNSSIYAINDKNSNKSKSVMLETKYYLDYDKLKAPDHAVVVYPIFTQSGYDWNGIHDFYTGRCDSCTSVPLHNYYEKTFSASGNAHVVLEFLGYDIIDDITLDKNPQILDKYEKVILLHNEFVTQNEFDAILNHPKVIYLYPNSLNSKIDADYSKNMITLVKGPGFPDESNTSGFNWMYDNSEQMQNWDCLDWQFERVENGYQLNCYPEQLIINDGFELLKTIKTI